ncbi:MAG: helical backbone metal receptor [Ferruginibacter sp.]
MILQSVTGLKNTPARIVSLVPSQTELLHFLDLEKETVAITKFCVHPKEWLTSKTIIGGTKNIHIEQVKNLHPDLIIANKEENTKEQVEELAASYPVWLTDVNDLPDAIKMISSIGRLTDTSTKATALIEDIRAGFSSLEIKKSLIPAAYLIWRHPFMTIGGDTFINDMMTRCGLQNTFAHMTRYPQTTVAELKEAGCRLLLLSSEPYPFKQQHIAELQASLPKAKILLVDGEMFSWYGSRLLKAPGYFEELMSKINAVPAGNDR